MKNFLLSLKFIIKRVFRLTAANIAWLIVTALIVAIGTAAMGVEPVARGDYDYQSYLMMLPYWLVFLSFGLSSMYLDVYASVYIRTSGLYKCLRTRAVQVFILLFDVVTLIPAVIVTAVVNPAALPDFLLVSAIIIGISLIGLFPHVDVLLRILDIQLTVALFRGRIYGRRLCVYAG